MSKAPWWVWASVVCCTVVSLYSVSLRNKVETSNRVVGLVMEMSDIEAIAMASGVSRPEALAELKKHGLVGVAITEDTVQSLVDKGVLRLAPLTGGEGPDTNAYSTTGELYAPAISENGYAQRTYLALRRRGIEAVLRIGGDRSAPQLVVAPEHSSAVLAVPLGIDPVAAADATDSGLKIVARLFNEFGSDPATIVASLRDANQAGADAYLIGGDQALGNKNLLTATETALETYRMQYLSPEFTSLGGDAFLRSALRSQTLRLHSVQQVEAETMAPSELYERFAKAYRERGVRWLLLRPTSRASVDLLKRTGDTLDGISRSVKEAGGEIGPPEPFEDPDVPSMVIGLIALLALPAVAWTVLETFGKGVLGILGVLAAIAATVGAFTESNRDLAALVIATAFPVLGYLVLNKEASSRPLAGYVTFSFISLAGGLCVAGMLVGVEYMLRIQQFPGVKLALFAPILMVGWLMLKERGPLRETFRTPVSWAAAAVAILGLFAVAMLALRSGNENPSAVSSLELQIRSLLDNFLHVRPRSKEVAFGHPALIMGLCLLAYRPNLKGWATLLLLAGMVGQTSIVNTFCHLHTPVVLSLARVGVGLALGGIIGLLLWTVVQRWMPLKETAD